ncbi:MAG: Holliday junction resolvase RuvX [Chthonomonadales bacterium]|nr:Holliday junction resolvase RuvX [Chthonomonadales bacterium]
MVGVGGMGRVLALDVGDRTIGLAVSDEAGVFAFPLETLSRQPEGHRRDVAAVARIAAEREVTDIVVGHPIRLDGTVGPQAEKVEAFVEQLRKRVEARVHLQDERLSTAECERAMLDADVRRERRKRAVDSMAASVILQSFLARGGRAAPPVE